jgi:hypothetical protein
VTETVYTLILCAAFLALGGGALFAAYRLYQR